MTTFLASNPEKSELNQYWYSKDTIKAMADEVLEQLEKNPALKCAFLSTPSIYFALPEKVKRQCVLLDYDKGFEDDAQFVHYDFQQPEELPNNMHHDFDMIVIDPPFITEEVWNKYTITCKLMSKNTNTKILLSTIAENQKMMQNLLNVQPQKFRPSIPNLVYQYCLYTNYDSTRLSQLNSEIDD